MHLAAIYDMTAGEEENHELNVGGTQRALDLAGPGRRRHLHHVSLRGGRRRAPRARFTEEMFDEGQELPSPYHRDQVRGRAPGARPDRRAVAGLPARPIVVGDSRTGEIDKVDGPYYFL